MPDLLDFVVEAHGGLAPWRNAASLSAKVRVYGEFWARKGHRELLGRQSITVDLSRQHTAITATKPPTS
ncbi:hypothetical protein GCM10023322_47670 [Rugosimonospora acidiphila]|uniref:Uncharacterized protein n=1 Tax=Rugosimonospora acidiphila TaxID=556531 RepID=A0ABP9S6I8_9ACTN